MILVVQSFGNEKEYRRAVFAILSFYAHSKSSAKQKTLLFTDNPEYFKLFLKDLPIDCHLLTTERMQEMRGRIDFLHRMKIVMIEQALSLGDDILYIDSDTFFIDDPKPVVNQLSPQQSFMHQREYSFNTLLDMPLPSGKAAHDFVNLIANKTFKTASGSSIKVNSSQSSWNAGVMILHRSVSSLIPDVYALTDQFYPGTHNHAAEQFAFSIVLQNNVQLSPCDHTVYHYWYRIKKKIVDIFLEHELTQPWMQRSLDVKLNDAREWTKALPKSFENHILTLRDNAIQHFCQDDFKRGYRFAIKALLKSPGDVKFIRDVMYHTKRILTTK
jgi:hypothetical protein